MGRVHTTKLEVMKDSYLYIFKQDDLETLLLKWP